MNEEQKMRCGMMENDMFQKIADTGAKTVRIVKPYADNGKVRDQLAFAEAAGAFGVGMDIDHIFGENGYDVVGGDIDDSLLYRKD